jgi:hypothetical protein
MPSPAHGFRGVPSEWSSSLFDQLNLQHAEHVDALAERLLTGSPPAVVVLGGAPGSGRGFVCDAAAQKVREQGHQVLVWHLDLDGFEPDGENPLAAFLRHLAGPEDAEAVPSDAAAAFGRLDLDSPASDNAAALLSFLWQLDPPSAPLLELLHRPPGGGPAARDDFATLRHTLAELARYRRLLVHVEDAAHLTLPLRRRLIRAAEESAGRLLLALSCRPDQASEEVAPEAGEPPARLDLELLDASELGDAINHPYAEVDERLTALAEEEPELARVLLDLLPLAALCGRYVPLTVLLKHMDLDEATSEAAVDWVDDVLIGEIGWLADLGFRSTGFPGYDVYAFTHPLLPQVILDQEPDASQTQWAENLLPFLEEWIPAVATRGWTRCLLSVAGHLDAPAREPFERCLAWWVGAEEAAELEAEIRAAIERDEIAPELVWRIARQSAAWPAWRRLALLDAYSQATTGEGAAAMSVMPFDHLAAFHLLRAELLLGTGRSGDSLAGVVSALRVIAQDPLSDLEISGAADRTYDAGAVAGWIGRLREILARDEAAIPPAELRQLRQELRGLLELA